MPSVRCFESLEAAAPLREQFNALNLRSARPDPFSTFEFLENFRRLGGFAQGAKPGCLWLLAVFEGEHLVGYLPLELRARRVLGVQRPVLGFLVTHHTDRPHVVAGAADLELVNAALRRYLLDRGREWSLLEFQQQEHASASPMPSSGADLAGYLVRHWPSLENCTITVRWSGLPDYVASLSKKFRMSRF